MVYEEEKTQTLESRLSKASPFLELVALFGIPAAGCVALGLLVQIPQHLSGLVGLFLLATEIGCLLCVFVQVLVLRACLSLPSAPTGLYRNVLDFLAVAHWHPSVKAALVGLLVLPPAWLLHVGDTWALKLLWSRGWSALQLSDVQDALDRIAVVYQLALTGGVPLLFGLHLLSRWKPKNRSLPWVLVPVVFVGAAIGVVLLVVLMHH
jgi:hypothetical protein